MQHWHLDPLELSLQFSFGGLLGALSDLAGGQNYSQRKVFSTKVRPREMGTFEANAFKYLTVVVGEQSYGRQEQQERNLLL